MTRDVNTTKIEVVFNTLSSGVFAGFGRITTFIDFVGHHHT